MDDVASIEEAVVFSVREKSKAMTYFVKSGAGEIVIEFGNFSIKVCVPERIGVKAKDDIDFAWGEIFLR